MTSPANQSLHIATFNLCNLFDVPADPALPPPGAATAAALDVQLTKLALTVTEVLRQPDIIAVQEVGSQALLQTLAARVNEATAADYRALAPRTSDRRGIRVGLLWDARRVRLAAGYQLEGADVTAAFGPGSASPGREPLLGEFDVAGERLTLLVNHFKSDYVPRADDASRDELIRRAQAQRLTQARVVREWASARLAADPRALLLVAGDLNAPPAGLPVRIVAGGTGETPLTNLLPAHAPAEYTFVLHGQPVILDHLLASPALAARLTAVSVPHPNAAAAPELAADPTTTARASDHDPLLATFKW